MTTRTFRRPSLKVIGRRRVKFHLDNVAKFVKAPDGTYAWFCMMAEANPIEFGTGVACGVVGLDYARQVDAEEAALEHLVKEHRASGGDKLPQGRGIARRARKIDEWNERRRAEANK